MSTSKVRSRRRIPQNRLHHLVQGRDLGFQGRDVGLGLDEFRLDRREIGIGQRVNFIRLGRDDVAFDGVCLAGFQRGHANERRRNRANKSHAHRHDADFGHGANQSPLACASRFPRTGILGTVAV